MPVGHPGSTRYLVAESQACPSTANNAAVLKMAASSCLAGQVDLNTQRMLRDVCNVTQIPRPGSDGDFIGPMLRLNTSRTEYTYWR